MLILTPSAKLVTKPSLSLVSKLLADPGVQFVEMLILAQSAELLLTGICEHTDIECSLKA